MWASGDQSAEIIGAQEVESATWSLELNVSSHNLIFSTIICLVVQFSIQGDKVAGYKCPCHFVIGTTFAYDKK